MRERINQKPEFQTGCKLLWLGVLAGPVAWLIQFQLRYSLVQWVCRTHQTFVLHLVSLIFLGCIVAACGWSWRVWQQLGRDWPSDAESGPEMRNLFLAVLSVVSNLLFSLLVIAQGLSTF